MTLEGRVTYDNDPMSISVRGMTSQIQLFNVYCDNIAFADTPGYQRKMPVVTTFAEKLGAQAMDTVRDTTVGRIHSTLRPLDFALNSQGYFQKLQADGRIEMTRDGRFKLDKNGRILSEDNLPVLSRQGTPIVLPVIPDKLDQIKVSTDGWISVMNPKTFETKKVAQIGVASETGGMADNVEVRQGFVEESNVFLHEEFVGMVTPKRSFQANRQMFLTTSNLLNRLIQELGRAQ